MQVQLGLHSKSRRLQGKQWYEIPQPYHYVECDSYLRAYPDTASHYRLVREGTYKPDGEWRAIDEVTLEDVVLRSADGRFPGGKVDGQKPPLTWNASLNA